jgi:hypothetical protein
VYNVDIRLRKKVRIKIMMNGFDNNMDELDKMLLMLETERVEKKAREDFKDYYKHTTPQALPVG